jgi:nitrite reductase/ring-hydroxylating ferredoxin subunit
MICDSTSLEDGGKGFRFEFTRYNQVLQAFAIRFKGTAYAYVNQCAHIPVELDWMQGEFFDYSKLYLICSTHGATYLPENGRCIAGPCKGLKLEKLAIEERDGKIYLLEGNYD